MLSYAASQSRNLANFDPPGKYCSQFCLPSAVCWTHGWVSSKHPATRQCGKSKAKCRSKHRAARKCSKSYAEHVSDRIPVQPPHHCVVMDLICLEFLDFPFPNLSCQYDAHPVEFLFGVVASVPRPCACPALMFVPDVPLVPVENFVSSYCWWFATADLTGLSPQSLLHQLFHTAALPKSEHRKLLAPTTCADEISFLVSILRHVYPTGLLICHQPALTFFLFLPECLSGQRRPLLLSFPQTATWLKLYPGTPIMLFAQETSSMTGHFVACKPLFSAKTCRAEQERSDVSPGLRPQAAMLGRGIFSDSVTSQSCSGGLASQETRSEEEVSGSQHSHPTTHVSSPASAPGKNAESNPFGTGCNTDSHVDPFGQHVSQYHVSSALAIQVDRANTSPARTCIDGSSQDTEQSDRLTNMSDVSQLSPPAYVPASVAWMGLEDDPISSFSEDAVEDPISSFSDDLVEIPQPRMSPGCSCIGFYAICLCGGAQYMRAHPVDLVVEAPCRSDLWCADTSSQRDVSSSVPSPGLSHHETAASQPTMEGGMYGGEDDRRALFAFEVQAAAPISIPDDAARAAAHRFPGDLDRAVGEACRLVLSPPQRQAETIDVSSSPTNRAIAMSSQQAKEFQAEVAASSHGQLQPLSSAHGHAGNHSAGEANLALQQAIPIGPARQPHEDATANGPLMNMSGNSQLCASVLSSQVCTAAAAFWRAWQTALEQTAEHLYRQHLEAPPHDVPGLTALFYKLPCAWPVVPADFNLSEDLLLQRELALFSHRAKESEQYRGAISDAWRQKLDVVKLLPFCPAVLCRFAEYAGIDRSFVFGFTTTLTGWMLHRDAHVQFSPLQPEHEVRPRVFATLIAEPNSGKSPFFKHCLEAVFVSKPGKMSLVESLQSCFASPGPGKDKTLFVQNCTNSDFARRMKGSGGHVFWMSEEAWSALDTAWAKGRNKVLPNERVEHSYLQNTQNGLLSYGPLSINAEQYYVATTNFGNFLCGQAKIIHDYWGMSLTADCPSAPWAGSSDQHSCGQAKSMSRPRICHM